MSNKQLDFGTPFDTTQSNCYLNQLSIFVPSFHHSLHHHGHHAL